MLQRWLLIWLCVLSTVAFLWPTGPELDPFLLSKPWLSQMIVVTMFALGWLLPPDEFGQVLRRWPSVGGGTLIQYLSMPLLAWMIASTFPLSDDFKIGIIMVGCVPGAMASNVLTMMARGNVSYSLSLTTLATCLSPLLVPVVLTVTLQQKLDQSLTRLVVDLTWMVLIPVVAGHATRRVYAKQNKHVDRFFQDLATLAILWFTAVVVGANRQRVEHLTFPLLAAVVVLNLLGYAAGRGGARLLRLEESMQRALILEIGMQNAGLGTTLASKLFQDQPGVMVPSALYTFGCMLTGTGLAWYWRGRKQHSSDEEAEVADTR